MDSYSIPDLLKLLQAERGDRVLLEAGFPPTLVVNGELHVVEGPPTFEESMEEMIRSVASTRELRLFRGSGTVDVIVSSDSSHFLVRAVRAFGKFHLEMQAIAT
jgi:Tfp pilus assembly ATPase PilU